MKRNLCLWITAILILLGAGSASAATLNVVGGQLLGATGVIVDGVSYNVEFLDGTCIALYNGCDEISDFTFQSGPAALLATLALFDQVFLDGANLFDTAPQLTVGCSHVSVCSAITPYGVGGGLTQAVFALNYDVEASDMPLALGGPTGFDTSGSTLEVYAVWTPVPPPVPSIGPLGTAVLLSLLGLTGLGWRGRSKRA